MSEYNMRSVGIEDLEDLLVVLNQLSSTKEGDRQLLRDILEEIIDDNNHHIVVIEHNKKVVATAMLMTRLNLSHGGKSVGYIENVVVDKEYRKQGLGKMMVEYLINEAKKLDCYKVILDAAPGSFHFYRNLGFVRVNEPNMRLGL